MAPAIEAPKSPGNPGGGHDGDRTLACFGLIGLGVILYQIEARAAGGLLHPSSAVMANLLLWRWGIVCLIAGVFGWVLIACAEATRPPLLPPWFGDHLEEDVEEAPDDE